MNKKNKQTLHFSLGPVQGFIGQARRTRDLWAGSFLLSWLSAQAMAELVNEHEGVMIFPKIENDPLYKAICNKKDINKKDINKKDINPYIATLPNRFQATVDKDFNANLLSDKINEKWQELANAVYEAFIENNEIENLTRDIWDRQIDNFWEVQWVLGDGANDLLDKRKNWRSQFLTVEGGEHCTTMGDYQELSGQKKGEQDNFWQKIRKNTSNISNTSGKEKDADYLNLRPNERLCAVAFVKRFFVRLGKDKLIETIGWVPGYDIKKDGHKDGEEQYYRPLANFPSTTYMAAVPWLEFLKNTNKQLLTKYYDVITKNINTKDKNRLQGETPTKLSCLSTDNWSNLDGNLFNQTALMNWRSTILDSEKTEYWEKGQNIDPDKSEREKILQGLQALGKGKNTPSASSNFYALLLMDGDSLGKLLRKPEQASIVSDCLAIFSQGVNDIVEKSCGVTIYAGGDDVLALVPIHKVICCAQRLRYHYEESFKHTQIPNPTISAAIIFSHFHNPFTEVIDQAHYQLEEIAKDKNDRNSIAMAIMKPGNLSAQWVKKWDNDLLQAFTIIADALRTDELPKGFFYKISGRYQHILKQKDKQFFTDIVTAELIKSKGKTAKTQLVDTIYQLCLHNESKDTLQLSALYFARFLADEDKSRGKQ